MVIKINNKSIQTEQEEINDTGKIRHLFDCHFGDNNKKSPLAAE